MSTSQTIARWWDREFDKLGKPIRPDVRAAAVEIWEKVCSKAQSTLGDATEAPELMESCVSRVSRSLDRRQVPLFSQKTAAMLMVTFGRELSRYAAKLRRTQPKGDTIAMEEYLPSSDWAGAIDSRLDLERVLVLLSPRSRAILALRTAGYDWNEIAASLDLTVSVAKNSFWRDLDRALVHLRTSDKCKDSRYFQKAASE
jgi:DNA-directed RNA polymerase specialized sigma24 family protein